VRGVPQLWLSVAAASATAYTPSPGSALASEVNMLVKRITQGVAIRSHRIVRKGSPFPGFDRGAAAPQARDEEEKEHDGFIPHHGSPSRASRSARKAAIVSSPRNPLWRKRSRPFRSSITDVGILATFTFSTSL
jgi:hypothetical protein